MQKSSRNFLSLKKAGAFCISLFLFFLAYVLFIKSKQDCSTLQTQLIALGWLAPFFYVSVATLSMLILVPRTLSVVIAGICFGTYWGTLWVVLTALVSAATSFLIARHYAREKFERLLRKRAWFYSFEKMAEGSGLSFVIFTRATHVIHFGLSNYAFGLLPIPFGHYLIGTLIGILPGTVALVYAGNTFGCSLIENGFHLPPEIRDRLLWGTVLLGLSSFLPLLWQLKKDRKS